MPASNEREFFVLKLRLSSFYCKHIDFILSFKRTNEGRAKEEDVSTVKWLSSYVNARRRQEQSEDTTLRELEKSMRHCPQSISIDSLQRHGLPTPSVKGRTPLASTHPHQINTKGRTDEKKTYIHVYFTSGEHFCTNCKLHTVIILRVVIFDITYKRTPERCNCI